MSTITIPAYSMDEPGMPDPVHYQAVLLIEGMDPDGKPWVEILAATPGMPPADRDGILLRAADSLRDGAA